MQRPKEKKPQRSTKHYTKNKHERYYIIPKGQSKMDNLAKLATYKTKCRVHKTHDADKQNKNTTQHELDTNHVN